MDGNLSTDDNDFDYADRDTIGQHYEDDDNIHSNFEDYDDDDDLCGYVDNDLVFGTEDSESDDFDRYDY